MKYVIRGTALAYAGCMVGTQIQTPAVSSALSLGFVLSAWVGYEVLEYLDRKWARVDSQTQAEVRMMSEALLTLTKRLDELEPKVQRIDNRTRRAGEP